MSIPPLVCSTPPPPDQCEDDKDPEDFELAYSLSQEDDDDDADNNGYNYGNFSYNYQPTPDNITLENKEQEVINNVESQVAKEFVKYDTEHNHSSHNLFKDNDINENKFKCDEDLSIEDLNLKVDRVIDCVVETHTEQNEISELNIGSVNDTLDIPSNSSNNSPTCDNITVLSFDEDAIHMGDAVQKLNTCFEGQMQGLPCKELAAKIEPHLSEVDIGVPHENNSSIQFQLEDSPIDLEDDTQKKCMPPKFGSFDADENSDDDFGDFDDFQSVNPESNITTVVETSNNPWENVDSNEFDCRNFTATFEESTFQNTGDFNSVDAASKANKLDPGNSEQFEIDKNLDENDDFGDFDDFKSSSVKLKSNDTSLEISSQCQELPVLNLQSTENENQIMESISKVLSSVFLEEISEPENPFEGTLESLLSETWGHLMETDERQPYIVNWNNSLGQKTLLKALCIDSRNILFGPKWSSNMPKYAANLSNAPLQPQKQASVSSSIVTQNEILVDKPTSKPTTWTDPFTSDGQEFTYAEALLLDLEHLMATLDQMAHNHSTLKISELLSHACNTENENGATPAGPTDLDVFKAALSTKPNKIYSNTMGVQPLRQINLPDTHIFTPSDSEIPRSKTIHYDPEPTVPVIADTTHQVDPVDSVQNSIDNSEYWEFQNFKSTTESSSLPVSNNQVPEKIFQTTATMIALPKPNIAYQTDLLQPIKVEPVMPTLNWPDPGEVKGGFDDFSDFVSMSSQSTEKQGSRENQSLELHMENISIDKSNYLARTNIDEIEAFKDIAKLNNESFDDDFDTFKSALPSKIANENDNFQSNNLENTIHQVSSQIPEFGAPKFDSLKSDTISYDNILRPNEALSQNIAHVSNTAEVTKISMSTGIPMQTNLLQPTPVSANTQIQQKSAQILQPLSLESYSQINWPSPGIDLQDLSRFNPVETLNSLKNDQSASCPNKGTSPIHLTKNTAVSQGSDDDVWGEFVSSNPKQLQMSQIKKPSVFVDDDEWTDFISSPSVKQPNGLNTISLNVHTNSNIQKSTQNKFVKKSSQPPLDIPTLNYITPKANPHNPYNDKHFQNL